MLNKIIFITSNNRSGSTVLDLLLGQHSRVCSLGELHNLKAYTNEDRTFHNTIAPLTCSCGVKLCECDFWKTVEQILNKDIKKIDLKLYTGPNSKKNIILKWILNWKNWRLIKNKLISKAIINNPALLDNHIIYNLSGYKQIALNLFELCKAAAEAASASFVVDSSKDPHRFKYLHILYPDNILIIHLVRNPAAVVFSMMKRGFSLDKALTIWLLNEKRINLLLKNIHPENKIFIKYEDLSVHTDETMRKICRHLKIDYENQMTELTIINKHHIGGSPSKFKYDGTIVYDTNFLQNLTQNQIEYILQATTPYSKQYGYSHKSGIA